ncbi:hypothetical protein DFJ73DRAFT_180817 [Zopfochytrium polystomum]|nr:hypothetical protein DFJ73DRAFT_180817 [Zopfochytrium polystomum]
MGGPVEEPQQGRRWLRAPSAFSKRRAAAPAAQPTPHTHAHPHHHHHHHHPHLFPFSTIMFPLPFFLRLSVWFFFFDCLLVVRDFSPGSSFNSFHSSPHISTQRSPFPSLAPPPFPIHLAHFSPSAVTYRHGGRRSSPRAAQEGSQGADREGYSAEEVGWEGRFRQEEGAVGPRLVLLRALRSWNPMTSTHLEANRCIHIAEKGDGRIPAPGSCPCHRERSALGPANCG